MVKQVVRNSLVIVVMHLFASMATGQSYRLSLYLRVERSMIR